jgi:Ca2+-binding RTX toxin-like protein
MTTITGTPDPDSLTGDKVWDAEQQTWVFAETADEIFGLGGDDNLYGGALSDTLWGGDGDDWMVGEDGSDILHGEADNDAMGGNAGDDTLYGGGGSDHLGGHQGHDTLYGGDGDDFLQGGLGDGAETEGDVFDGGPGNDWLFGNSGVQTMDGGTGTDTAHLFFIGLSAPVEFVALTPGATIVPLVGGAPYGSITNVEIYHNIWGGNGNDTLGAAYVLPTGAGYLLVGGDGEDTAVVDMSADPGALTGGTDTSTGWTSIGSSPTGGTLNIQAEHIHYTGNALNGITFGAGNDRLTGLGGADTFNAGGGNDTINGGGGADLLYGGEGNDAIMMPDMLFARVEGGPGTDALELTGAGLALNLATVGEPRILGIERIDLTGAGHNALALTAASVLAMDNGTNQLLVDGNAGDSVSFTDAGWQQGATAGGRTTYTNAGATVAIETDVAAPPCFAAGTLILTQRGEIAVEALREGDRVVVASAPGARPVRWIGHRRVKLAGHPRPWDVQPVRVHAGAFAPGQPHRDLRLSPDHAIHADGVLIPVRYLVNGATVTQESVADVTYYHVELAGPDGAATHDILFANGLETESYLDTGNRAAFANAGPVATLHPAFGRDPWDAGCAPLLLDGPEVEALRVHLQAQATTIGFALTRDPALHLVVDGAVVEAASDGTTYRFTLPQGARDIRLVSRSTAPAETRPDRSDTRRLGVAITRLDRDGTKMALDDPRLAAGWHAPEADLRWTTGNAALALAGARTLAVTVAPLEAYWVRTAPIARRGRAA